MPKAMLRDLTGLLLGNFSFNVKQGSKLSMTIRKDEAGPIGADFHGTIIDAHWESPAGKGN